MIDKIKKSIMDYEGKTLHFKYNGSRNQIEEFFGVIVEIHKSLFVVKPCDSDILKTYSYADVLIGLLKIKSL